MRGAGDERVRNVGGPKRFVGAAVGIKAALAVGIDERDEPPGREVRIAREMRRHARFDQPRRLGLDVGRADPRDEIDLSAERGEPCGLIGGRPARLEADHGAPVGALRQRPLGLDYDVGHHVADEEDAGAFVSPATHHCRNRRPASAPKPAQKSVASGYQVATKSGESSGQCEA